MKCNIRFYSAGGLTIIDKLLTIWNAISGYILARG